MSPVRLKVSARIYLGFGALAALGICVAAFGVYQFANVETEVVKMTALAANLQRALEVSHYAETIRRTETRYRLDRDAAALKEMADTDARARALLMVAARVTLSEERRQTYNGVIDALRAHAETFGRFSQFSRAADDARTWLFGGGNELTAATGRLVAAARAAHDQAVSEAAASVENSVLLVRVANWRFLATNDPKGPGTFTANIEMASATIAKLEQMTAPDTKALVAPVQAALQAYAANFAAFSEASLKGVSVYENEMRPQIIAIGQQLATTEQSLRADFTASSDRSREIVSQASLLQELLAGISLVLGAGLAILIGRGIVGPLAGMTGVMTKLAAGDKTVVIPARDNRDEIGDMARAVEVFKQNAIEADRIAAGQAAERAIKERRQAALEQHTQDFGASISGVMAGLAASAEAMRSAAAVMDEAAGGVRTEATNTAGSAAQSSQDLVSVAAAVEQLTASVDEISRQIAAATDVSRQAVQRAEAGQNSIRGLADSTSRIGDVVRLISEIAGQTNLLALNATIEAARAGEAGRGFAVVAGEVKALAAQTARATAEIGQQIETVRGATEQSVAAMTEVGTIISKIDEVTAAISAAVEEQSATTRDIASSIQDVSQATAASARAMEHVVAVANEAGDASRDVSAGTAGIGQQAETLRTEVDNFLAAVKETGDDRRGYERIRTNGAIAGLHTAGREPVRVELRDVSRGGAALACKWPLVAGTAVDVDLPGAGGWVAARVVRRDADMLAVVFSSEATALARIDRALDAFQPAARAA
jgi:methyl-accepting chemotaxis protein